MLRAGVRTIHCIGRVERARNGAAHPRARRAGGERDDWIFVVERGAEPIYADDCFKCSCALWLLESPDTGLMGD